MRKIKRILALLLAATMVFSVVGCKKDGNKDNGTDETTAESKQEGTGNEPQNITVNLHYLREDGNYEGWNVWFWTVGDGWANEFSADTDENGAVTSYVFEAGTKSIGFIVRLNEWESKDIEEDRYIDTSSILAGTVDVYVKSGEAEFETKFGDDCVTGTGIASAMLDDDLKTITVFLTDYYEDGMVLEVLDSEGNVIEPESLTVDEKNEKKVVITFKEELNGLSKYDVRLDGKYKYGITIPDVYTTASFEKEYTYTGNDLGATWSKKKTTFKVWAPVATAVSLNLYNSGDKKSDEKPEVKEMTKAEKGVWEITVEGDLNGRFYTYTATNNGSDVETCDPYATAVGVNGDRAMVIDLESTNPSGWDKDKNPNSGLNYTDASIYELHVRDLSSDKSSGIKNTGKYLGLTEKGTVNSAGISTGLDHIIDLGVTHVQLNPVYDYATVDESVENSSQYNWGYDPKNYNVPEGSYATDAYDGGVRINEFKQMVQSLHSNGLSVVMDVVYNHTYSTDFSMSQLVPGYFHRPNSNGSGCGNDVATERLMVRKFIVDSVVYWAKEYHIDGFRFDLVGLMDVETMNEIRAALDEIDPSIILYGEGWSLSTTPTKDNTTLATQTNVVNINNFGMFNDTIRDTLKGSVFDAQEKGYVNGVLTKDLTIYNCIQGKVAWSKRPFQQINYASCHDNMTLWDEINTSNADDSLEARIDQNLLSAAIVFTSQGVPFILAGEEMLRTKTNSDGTFNSNSYNAPDSVNSIKWDDLSDKNYQMVNEYYKGLIAFRKAHASFRNMDECSSLYTRTDAADGVIAYELAANEEEISDSIFVIHNASTETTTVTLPEGKWTICVQGHNAGCKSLGTAAGSIKVDGISTTILVKGALK